MDDRTPVRQDLDRALVVDGNAAGGALQEIFGTEMTAGTTECGHCAREGAIGTLLGFVEAPGTVPRCPRCHRVVIRVVDTEDAVVLDVRGAVYPRIAREA